MTKPFEIFKNKEDPDNFIMDNILIINTEGLLPEK